ncbi:MAG: aminopeptidase N [Pseudomonadota bacterium]
MTAPAAVRLADYQPFPWGVESVELRVELDRECTRVHSTLSLVRSKDDAGPIRLNGVGLTLETISVDGRPLTAEHFRLDEELLLIEEMPPRCTLETTVVISPASNHGDEGLFELGGKLATQCESEGFRRITFFPDRPDVLSRFDVTLVGDPARYPVMLSNGHQAPVEQPGDGRVAVRWVDPFPKPCYLFAMIAGDFGVLREEYAAPSGRKIELAIYADHERIEECGFAMGALKRALRWEEERYGLEYDLDVYNIVALTGHVGAMENKGLNVFDANGICADPDISTDEDYRIIERILAHEVFHNWTGNRVTCRDWFQLSLKEGLTRFRDQCFSQDMGAPGIKRIEFVRALKRNQFPEDDGPAAHPVRPAEYIEIRNFYTATVYDKGAEVIRMLHCLLGDAPFREGVVRYLERYDQQAVTVEDFVAEQEAVSGRSLDQFYRWYRQAGRPRVQARGHYDAEEKCYTLHVSQSTGGTAASDVQPFHIPVLAELLDSRGQALAAVSLDAGRVDGNLLLELTANKQTFRFEGVSEEPVPSLLRGFSAPVSLDAGLSSEQQALLWSADGDDFNRWQAGQDLATTCIRAMAAQLHSGSALTPDELSVHTWSGLLADHSIEPGLLAELLLLPDEPSLSEGLALIDIDGHAAARDCLLQALAKANRETLLARFHDLADLGPYTFDSAAVGRRSLRNRCLEILLAEPDDEVLALALRQVRDGSNMTDQLAALRALCHVDAPERQVALDSFYRAWQHKPPVLDKWFNAQALSRRPGAINDILALEQHPDMDLMNVPRAMAFYGGFFRQNRIAFNSPDGRAYDMLAERLILIDSVKPGTTFWLMPQLLQWRRFDGGRRGHMREALQKVLAADISKGLYETVSKALEEDTP